MKRVAKFVVKIGLLSHPFYAGDTKLTGHYKVIQPDANADELLLQISNGKHSVFVDFVPI
jgi:hypothetical protein